MCYSSKEVPFSSVIFFVSTIILCFVSIFLQWPFIYIFGHFIAGAINDDVLEQYSRERLEKKKIKAQKKKRIIKLLIVRKTINSSKKTIQLLQL